MFSIKSSLQQSFVIQSTKASKYMSHLPPTGVNKWVRFGGGQMIGTRNLCRRFRSLGFPRENPFRHRLSHICPLLPLQLCIPSQNQL